MNSNGRHPGPSSDPWFRLYQSIYYNYKLAQLSDQLKWKYIGLLCYMNSENRKPKNCQINAKTLSKVWQLRQSRVVKYLDSYVQVGLIEKDKQGNYLFPKFFDHQYESDSSTERVRSFRERMREEPEI